MAKISVAGDTSSHGGAPFNTGLSTTVTAGDKKVALKDQTGSSSNDNLYNNQNQVHNAGNQTANAGSATVFANDKAVHRVGDSRKDGATGGPGITTVNVG